MRDRAFRDWLSDSGKTVRVVSDYASRCNRVEQELRLDLDAEYQKDHGIELLRILTYTKDDAAGKVPPQISFRNGADIYNGMASIKSSVNSYFSFLKNDYGVE